MKLSWVTMWLALSAGAQPPTGVEAITWLAGSWSGAVGKVLVEEHWLTPAGGAMLGTSRTLARDRMVAFEFLRIEERADGVYYVAQPGGRPPTDFRLTAGSPTEAVFENPRHDFPRIIRYRLEGDTLRIQLTGEEKGKTKDLSYTLARRR